MQRYLDFCFLAEFIHLGLMWLYCFGSGTNVCKVGWVIFLWAVLCSIDSPFLAVWVKRRREDALISQGQYVSKRHNAAEKV